MLAKADGAEPKTFDPGFVAEGEDFSLEHAQLLAEGKDLETKVAAGTEENAETGEEADEKWNHGPGFIA